MSDFKGDSVSDAVDVLNLKVVDIKKRLKALGLPSTGKKSELVARLQAALMATRDAAADDSGKSEEIDLSEDLDESCHSKDLEIDLKDEGLEKEKDAHGHLDSEGVVKFQDAQIVHIASTTIVSEDLEKNAEIDLNEDLDESFNSKDLEMDLKDEDSEKEDFKEHELLDQRQVFTHSEDVGKFQGVKIFHIASNTIVPSDQSQVFTHSEDVGKLQGEKIVHISSNTKVPSIKRSLPQEEVETVKPRKKICLKRNNYPTPIWAAKVGKAEEGEVKQSGDIAEKSNVVPGTPNESRKPIIKLTNNPYKGLSDSAKQEKRAIRFNISSQDFAEKITESDADKKKQYPRSQAKPNAKPQQKLSGSYPAPSLDVLRKRSERFGETVSTVLKNLEDEEKLNQRKIRFGGNKHDNELEDKEKLNQRKIRFGISASGNKDDEEKKKKRAERFGK
ncbi:hypothetical protein JTE90_016854 [Oedothorax gibbosus]|uniref:SAP domain-containing protein n=1 Tax=Oedothorax gibbosus TaxID=931172 RepID=A0AAV6VXL5_9ARAC|nr:hypothetical protein JTE90_016854 [Oedothorax gibbosus]